jgi:hypothetical protein
MAREHFYHLRVYATYLPLPTDWYPHITLRLVYYAQCLTVTCVNHSLKLFDSILSWFKGSCMQISYLRFVLKTMQRSEQCRYIN